MSTIFSKNCILKGTLEYYCLLCAECFRYEEDTIEHIVNLQHMNKLKSCNYLERFEKDHIRKINSLYFCGLCSMTFNTAKNVEIHISSDTHRNSQNNMPKVKNIGNENIAFGPFMITGDAWHTFIDDTCILCDVEFDDGATHKASLSHMLNIINNEVTLEDEMAYRRINNNYFQCLTCNVMITGTYHDRNRHCNSTEHESAYTHIDYA